MALVNIGDYSGTIIENAVMDIVEELGFLNLVNKRGYILYVRGIQGETPDGMVDDEPESHRIELHKRLTIAKAEEVEFTRNGRVNKALPSYRESLEVVGEADFKVVPLFGIATVKDSKQFLVSDGYCEYEHLIHFTVDKNNKTDEEYVIAIVDTLLAIVLGKKV